MLINQGRLRFPWLLQVLRKGSSEEVPRRGEGEEGGAWSIFFASCLLRHIIQYRSTDWTAR